MSITPLPALDRTDPTFKADVNNFFGVLLPNFTTEVNTEINRLNTLGFGSYTGTSATSNAVGTGSKSFTIETGKGFVVGQFVVIANTASPANYMLGQVTSYNSGTGALVVNVTVVSGSGTFTAWTLAVTSAPSFSATVEDFTSSGTWTRKGTFVMVELYGGGGGGGSGRRGAAGTQRDGGYGGGGGAYRYAIYKSSDLPSTVSIGIGAGGIAGASQAVNTSNGNAGSTGGDTSFGTLLKAFGGGGGDGGGTSGTGNPGGGGGVLSAGSGITGGFPFSYTTGFTSSQGQFGGALGIASGNGAESGFGGGSGSGLSNGSPARGVSAFGGAGGGAGGILSSANAVTQNGQQGAGTDIDVPGGAGGTNANGTAGGFRQGGGGGGPVAAGTTTRSGGAGGIAGGGGGGAPSTNGTNSGAGGAGGPGFARIYSW